MILKKSFEKFLCWYVPLTLVFKMLELSPLFLARYMHSWNFATISKYTQYALYLPLLMFIPNIIAAVWLFKESGKDYESPRLWAMFGLIAGLWAIMFFLIFHLMKSDNDKQ